jgi:hypothetical protein
MKTITLKQWIGAAAAGALLAGAGGALAQQGHQGGQQGQGGGQQAMQQPGAGAVEVDDATVSNFADAFLSVQEISQGLSDQLAEAEGTEAAQEMQQEAQQEMAEAVEEAGISVSDYNQIAVGMRQDPELAERVREAVDDKR